MWIVRVVRTQRRNTWIGDWIGGDRMIDIVSKEMKGWNIKGKGNVVSIFITL